jgi:hypothetical protein
MLNILSVVIKMLGGASIIAASGILFYLFALGVPQIKAAIPLFLAILVLVLGVVLLARGLKEYLKLD